MLVGQRSISDLVLLVCSHPYKIERKKVENKYFILSGDGFNFTFLIPEIMYVEKFRNIFVVFKLRF